MTTLAEIQEVDAELRAEASGHRCMRCAGRLLEERGLCSGCELLLLDDVVRLKGALEVALRGERQMLDQLTATQARCTELLEQVRVTPEDRHKSWKHGYDAGLRVAMGTINTPSARLALQKLVSAPDDGADDPTFWYTRHARLRALVIAFDKATAGTSFGVDATKVLREMLCAVNQ